MSRSLRTMCDEGVESPGRARLEAEVPRVRSALRATSLRRTPRARSRPVPHRQSYLLAMSPALPRRKRWLFRRHRFGRRVVGPCAAFAPAARFGRGRVARCRGAQFPRVHSARFEAGPLRREQEARQNARSPRRLRAAGALRRCPRPTNAFSPEHGTARFKARRIDSPRAHLIR